MSMQFIIASIYKYFFPFKIRFLIWQQRNRINNALLKLKILSYFKQDEKEFSKELVYLRNNKLSIFPYNSIRDFNPIFEIFKDNECGLLYVYFESKKMYFKRNMNFFEVKSYYLGILKEQHLDSPHRYLTEKFNINFGDSVADIGVAEGIFSLSIIEKSSIVYLFEPDLEWIEALNYTFKPWKSKVQIISKFVSNRTDILKNIKLDDFFKLQSRSIDFIKVDVDGGEKKLLEGSNGIFSSNKNIKIAICTYHNQSDAEEFEQFFTNKRFNVEFSEGFMLFLYDNNFAPPYFRKGVIRAEKNSSSY